MIRFGAILLGLLLISVNSASAKMYFLPDYQDSLFINRVNDYKDKSGTLHPTPSSRSCSDYSGFISADKKGNMTCSVIKYFPQIGNCYSDCKCDSSIYKYTSANCSSLGGDICTDLSGNTYYSGCGDKCNGITGKDCGSFRCKKYYTDCSSECETCYTDTCDYPENISYPLESSCDYGCDTRGHIEGCDKRCYACGNCQANDCSTYTLTSKSDANAEYEQCIAGCGNNTPKYKFLKCKNGYELEGGVCVVTCEPNDCSTYTLTSKSDANAEYEQCIAGCGNNTPKYKFKKCKNGYELEGGVCVGTCEPNDCSGYDISYQADSYAEYLSCDLGCGQGYMYKFNGCITGYTAYNGECCKKKTCPNTIKPDEYPGRGGQGYTFCIVGCGDDELHYLEWCPIGYKHTGNYVGTKPECTEVDGAISFDLEVVNSGATIELLLSRATSFDTASINWGDGSWDISLFSSTHTYQDPGVYTIEILGSPSFFGIEYLSDCYPIKINSLDLESVTKITFDLDMERPWSKAAFYDCSHMTGTIPSTIFPNLQVGDGLFGECNQLEGDFPTLPESLTSARNMFYDCSGLSGNMPILPNKLATASSMFYNCTQMGGTIQTVDSVNAFSTKLKKAGNMFYNCSNLRGTIPAFHNNMTEIGGMFSGCSNIEGTIPTLPDNTAIISTSEMFKGCSKLEGPIPNLPQKPTFSQFHADYMFDGCENLTGTIPALPPKLYTADAMFRNCSKLEGGIPEFPSTVRDAMYMFYNCSGLTGDAPTLSIGHYPRSTGAFYGTQITPYSGSGWGVISWAQG